MTFLIEMFHLQRLISRELGRGGLWFIIDFFSEDGWNFITLMSMISNVLLMTEWYSKSRGNRYGCGKVLHQKIHFRVQKMAKMNFLKTNG